MNAMQILLNSLGVTPEKLAEMEGMAGKVAEMLAAIKMQGEENARSLAEIREHLGMPQPEYDSIIPADVINNEALTREVTAFPAMPVPFNSPPIGSNNPLVAAERANNPNTAHAVNNGGITLAETKGK